ncbi:MAG: carboxypeptidase-like regulatory domain-containing protein, partial [Planctomycetes bacterium]|nr:carboxypeptidase-like regulatory domain-containing protein [Planctomycetota bacterium]
MRKLALPLLALLGMILAYLFLQETPHQGGPLVPLADEANFESTDAVTAAKTESDRVTEAEEAFSNRSLKVGGGAHSMDGKVVDEQGKPVPGAWVAAYSVPFPLIDFELNFAEILENPLDFDLEPLAATFANEKGEFDLEGLYGRTLYLTARTKQRLTPRRQRVLPDMLNGQGEVILRTVAGASLSGQVVNAQGAPVENAEVVVGPGIKFLLAAFRNRTFFVEKVFTDASGRFDIEALPAGATLTVNAYKSGTEAGMKELPPLAANTNGMATIDMFPTGELAGSVTDLENEAISNASVIALPLDLRLVVPFIRDPMVWSTKTTSKGVYQFKNLPQAMYLLIAQGYEGRSAPATARVSNADSLAPILQIDTARKIKGRVVDGQGKPVPRALVKLQSIPEPGDDGRSGRERFNTPGGLLFEAAREILPEFLPETTFVLTQSDGSFEIPGWRRARLRVEANGYSPFDFSLRALNNDSPEIAVLQIFKPGSVAGSVVSGEDSDPIQFALVRAEHKGNGTNGAQRADGVSGATSTYAREAAAPVEEQPEENHEIQPQKPAWLKEGELRLYPENSWRAQAGASAFIDDAKGRFRIDGLAPGEWTLVAQAEGFSAERARNITVRENELTDGIVLDLKPGATVSGRVFEAGTDNPVPGAVVTVGKGEESGMMAMLQGLGESIAMAETDDAGYFTVKGAEEGSDHVNVLAEGYAAASTEMEEGLQGFEHREGIRVEVEFGGTLTGMVYDRNNNPLPGRMVGALSIQAKDFQQTAADADGRYTMKNMRAGSYFLVTAALDDESLFTGDMMTILAGSKMTTATIRENEVSTVDIIDSAAGGTRLEGELSDDGTPIPGANLLLVKAGGGMLDLGFSTARTDKNGQFLFKSVEPGLYRIQIESEDWRGALETEVMDAAEDCILLEIPNSTVRGQVVAEGLGTPIANARVSLENAGKEGGSLAMMMGGGRSSSRERTNEQGMFAFSSVPPGDYRIKISSNNGSEDASYGALETKSFLLREDMLHDAGILELPAATSIKIRVVNESGDAFGSWVQATAEPVGGGETLREWGNARRSQRRSEGGDQSVQESNDQTVIEIRGVTPGIYTVRVTSSGMAPWLKQDVVVLPGETPELQATLTEGGSLKVSVFDSQGTPAFPDALELVNQQGEVVRDLGE